MQTLKDVLTERQLNNINIMYRTNSPVDWEEDMLVGYCRYEEGKLISLDNDSYSLEDCIVKHEMDIDNKGNEYLVVWIESEWTSTNDKEDNE